MKKKTKVLLSLVFALALIFTLLVPTFAAYDDNGYVVWELKDNCNTLVGEKEYYRIEIPTGYRVSASQRYYFANTAKYEKITLTGMYTNYDGKNIVYATERNGMKGGYFADQETYDFLSEFFVISQAKDTAHMILFGTEYEYFKDGDKQVLGMLDSMTGTALNVPVSTLENYNKTQIYAYDTTGWIRTTLGCVYALGDTRYYVDFTTLPNNYFDSDGQFSYRGEGAVPAVKLDGKTDAAFQGLKSSDNQYFFDWDDYYERDTFDIFFPDLNEDVVVIFGIVIFYSILIFVGLVLPVIPIVLGLMLPRSKKLGKHPGWYALAVAGAVWLIAALILIIYITVCFIMAVW